MSSVGRGACEGACFGRSAIVSRFRFNSCVRQHGESVAAYVARLRQLTEYCEYGTSLEEMLHC